MTGEPQTLPLAQTVPEPCHTSPGSLAYWRERALAAEALMDFFKVAPRYNGAGTDGDLAHFDRVRLRWAKLYNAKEAVATSVGLADGEAEAWADTRERLDAFDRELLGEYGAAKVSTIQENAYACINVLTAVGMGKPGKPNTLLAMAHELVKSHSELLGTLKGLADRYENATGHRPNHAREVIARAEGEPENIQSSAAPHLRRNSFSALMASSRRMEEM